MTIAACYVSPEGVVFGADSTTTYAGPHYFNHGQKLFEVGEESTLGVVTWGLGGLAVGSHRTLIALLADDLVNNPPKNVSDVAARWAAQFSSAYTRSLAAEIAVCQTLGSKSPHDPTAAPSATMRTKSEEDDLQEKMGTLGVGFCVGGFVMPDRTPDAYALWFDPLNLNPAPLVQQYGCWNFWGAPNMIKRLIFGCDDWLKANILSSGKWTGTAADLDALIAQCILSHPALPIRDAIDFIHACITSTIKAMKFSNFSQICGGPVEIAVITSDRKFRWVRHKAWDAAIAEGEG